MVMETPDEMLARLDRMGEDRVRALLGQGEHFEPNTWPLVRGWLESKGKKRNGDRDSLPNIYAAFENVRTVARQAAEAAEKADEKAMKAQLYATIAIAVGSASALVAVLALFALAIR